MAKHLNPLEKEFLIRKYRSNPAIRLNDFCSANSVSNTSFKKWLTQYDEGGLEGLSRADAELGAILPVGVDRTEEAYKREILRLRIEHERLKKLCGAGECGWANGVCSFKNEEFKIVDMLSRDYAITDICALMGVSHPGVILTERLWWRSLKRYMPGILCMDTVGWRHSYETILMFLSVTISCTIAFAITKKVANDYFLK